MHKNTKYDLVMTLTTLWLLLLRALKLLYVGREKSDARVAYVRVQSTAAIRLFTLRTYVQRNEIHFALSFDPQSYVFGDFSRSSKDQSVMEIQDGKLSQNIETFSIKSRQNAVLQMEIGTFPSIVCVFGQQHSRESTVAFFFECVIRRWPQWDKYTQSKTKRTAS